ISSNNSVSELGIGDRTKCSYTKLKNDACLGFTDAFPVTGVAKKHSKKGIVVTFGAKNTPVYRVELKKLKQDTPCDDILLFKKISIPCISMKRGMVGSVPNGAYSVAMAYSVDGKIFSDFYSISN